MPLRSCYDVDEFLQEYPDHPWQVPRAAREEMERNRYRQEYPQHPPGSGAIDDLPWWLDRYRYDSRRPCAIMESTARGRRDHDDIIMATMLRIGRYGYEVPWEKSPERLIAEAKGDLLLKDVLGEAAFSNFKSSGFVDVPSIKDSNVGYRIRGAGRMIGLLRKENGVWVEENKALCVHPANAHSFVPGDQISSQVLICKFDEGLLWSKANLHERRAA